MGNPFLKVQEFVVDVLAELKKSALADAQGIGRLDHRGDCHDLGFGMFVALADLVFLRVVALLTRR
jgi:hypothetical protein